MYLSTTGEIVANVNGRKVKGHETRDRAALTLASMQLGSTTYGPGTPIEVVSSSLTRKDWVVVKCLLDQMIGEVPAAMQVLR